MVVLRPLNPTANDSIRHRWLVRGQIQGVGFRPFVYRLALEHRVSGFVRNQTDGVVIEAQGSQQQLQEFARELVRQKPPLAVIDAICCSDVPVCRDDGFHIVASQESGGLYPEVTIDTAVCPDCLREMLDERDRRRGYGLINCTNCGPRYSIVRRVPYDRPNTTMAAFEMCQGCRSEYERPEDRRFHAQPIACHACGPKLSLVDSQGKLIDEDPIAGAVKRLAAGKILAIKGLGGFHLAVRADDRAAVVRLRELKKRDHKPFALMCANVAVAERLVELSEAAKSVLESPAAPIMLAVRKEGADVAEGVAAGNHRLGVMLPYTPIHHLLFAHASFDVLIMTSGNVSDEPLVIDNNEAVERLGGLCDAILLHDRPIERCVDDSVMLDMATAPVLPIRRARGYVPGTLRIPIAAASMGLCLGGELKNTVAAVREDRVILSQHLGDLTHAKGFEYFKRAIDDLRELFAIEPRWIAHDLHPIYLSTGHAREMAKKLGLELIPIQHHHAHAAAVMAEHGETNPVLAVVCDGTGYGTDGTIWGGELLLADLVSFRRLGRIRPIWLAGGDAAARDTRRCGLALLHQTFGDDFSDHPASVRLVSDKNDRRILCQMIRRRISGSASSGAGRLFDGVAALLGLCFHNGFEAQAGMAMEAAAAKADGVTDTEDLFEIRDGHQSAAPKHTLQPSLQDSLYELDFSRFVREMVGRFESGAHAEELSSLFHDQLARGWAAMVLAAAERSGVRTVALSGGVFCNQRLTEALSGRLEQRGLRVLRHRLVPPNDGGLAYGQAAIAAAHISGLEGGKAGA